MLEHQTEMGLVAKLIRQNQRLLDALGSCVEQIEQMQGMFDDEDGTIQAALEEARKAIDMATAESGGADER
jgi:hypothetical protein